MKLNDLIEELQKLQEQGFGEQTVKIVQQPSYPLMSDIRGLSDSLSIRFEDEEAIEEHEVEAKDVVYIFCSEASEYGPSYKHLGY